MTLSTCLRAGARTPQAHAKSQAGHGARWPQTSMDFAADQSHYLLPAWTIQPLYSSKLRLQHRCRCSSLEARYCLSPLCRPASKTVFSDCPPQYAPEPLSQQNGSCLEAAAGWCSPHPSGLFHLRNSLHLANRCAIEKSTTCSKKA